MVSKLVMGAGAGAIVAIAAGAFILSGQQAPDRGAGTNSSLPNATNVPKNDQMTPVNPNEASRRATVNQEDAEKAKQDGRDYQAPTVITGVGPADKGVEPYVPEPPKAVEPQERVIKETTERTVYVTKVPVEQPINDAAERQKIEAQIAALLGGNKSGGTGVQMVVKAYAAPPEPKPEAKAEGPAGPRPPSQVMLARTGDVIFGRLDRGFNSDDPSAPIIITLDDVVYDPVQGSRPGPLTGMRLVGQITYSDTQSAISFNQIVTNTGRQFPITAIAVSESDARTGIATKVNKHTWSRYAGLFASSLLQGAGQVANQLVQNNRTVSVSDGVVTSGANSVNYGQAAVAALQPLGNNLASIAGQHFSRPPTMTAPAGTGLGVVFLAPVVLPKGLR